MLQCIRYARQLPHTDDDAYDDAESHATSPINSDVDAADDDNAADVDLIYDLDTDEDEVVLIKPEVETADAELSEHHTLY